MPPVQPGGEKGPHRGDAERCMKRQGAGQQPAGELSSGPVLPVSSSHRRTGLSCSKDVLSRNIFGHPLFQAPCWLASCAFTEELPGKSNSADTEPEGRAAGRPDQMDAFPQSPQARY